ncbi:MAG: homoserine dehydrogenase [Myxococcales bacterium]|nr:homoserine dehydrogenase [Myxococcales bacterium]
MRTIAIGVLGLGNVGTGTLQLLRDNRDAIEARVGARLDVRAVLVRDPNKPRDVELGGARLTTRPADILDDPEIEIVVELIGGLDPARDHVLRALRAGKHVVTANKALLAERGEQIFAEASQRGLAVFFEGSVAGGTPLLRSLREGLASDRIEALTGIVNGTSNYILDAMTRTGARYEDALRAAQEAGYAEADPTLDVDGSDAAHKLALLALVSFGVRVDPGAIHREGVTGIDPFDIKTADELGYVIKSLAIARRSARGVSLRVHPTMVPKTHVLAGVHGSYNACLVESRALGRSLYYGRGAGPMPTGVAVVSDVIEVARLITGRASHEDAGARLLPKSGAQPERVDPLPLDELECENYLCIHVPNQPGVLGRCAACLGRHGVSIKRMFQEAPRGDAPVSMVIFTESVPERSVAAALAEMSTFDILSRPTDRIRILDPDTID